MWHSHFALLSIFGIGYDAYSLWLSGGLEAVEASVVDFGTGASSTNKFCGCATSLRLERMVINKHRNGLAGTSEPARRASGWHPWTVIVPRRSITGEFVFGQVWRRYDGRRWIYRKHVEYADRGRQDS